MSHFRNSVDQIVDRYARLHKIDPMSFDEDCVRPALRLKDAQDIAGLDRTECLIVEFHRDQLISDRKMIDLLRRHQKEVTGRH
ncbi:hypothetical protein CKO11_11695 [Rhodobacter sp. TJ_12]|uniref:hypothetical protein n=1 Tax=Rhodobacter sp. TJ_12 TaxID=2029399 RepID=UPI001CBEC91A|nr:hypothetical protein [Rhodobacter sp. TJ_12]MBZ4023123.1 hypothetical protein [Rhodobacter sp. TJ_12]